MTAASTYTAIYQYCLCFSHILSPSTRKHGHMSQMFNMPSSCWAWLPWKTVLPH